MRSQAITSLFAQRKLCLTGTPLQNNLEDLQSFIKFLEFSPWDNDTFWKYAIAKPVSRGNAQAINTLQLLMGAISLQRIRSTLLNLPKKVIQDIKLELKGPWKDKYREYHDDFMLKYGKNGFQGGGASQDFFSDLNFLGQFCNHPALSHRVAPPEARYMWQDSSKVEHLVHHLQLFLRGSRGIVVPKAVVFSEYWRFLEM